MAARSRYDPCDTLRAQDIPCLVYFEDAIAAYGVPTALFDLYLLVPDLAEAEETLLAAGWTTAPPLGRVHHFLNSPLHISHRRLLPPPGITTAEKPPSDPAAPPSQAAPGPTTTVLLPAACWTASNIDEIFLSSPDTLVPPLPVLLDGLIKALLDLPPFDQALSDHLATQISYLYGHCDALKTQDFGRELMLEHRQFHYDALSKPGLGTVPFLMEQQRIREDVRNGKHEPQRNAWYLPPTRT
ncbi:hypothetical protein C8A00DRAFT_17003 [Chaetomidium leptoderma]|uniref:Uncharacterized protein n=1 Tax=Chaetomidium leptoderma TaxID=669021 RepID=A0AAN6VHW2_9PEZI|nr:hypothetical protein C8A00DRAFT_17003 [Chaetomidium leptoderma]